MFKHWWVENRWLLTKRILYGVDCLIILLIPFIRPPYSYVAAISVVITLAIFFRDFTSSYREAGADR